MLRRNWRRFIPIYAILPLATTGLMNLFAYQLPKLIQLLLHSACSYDLTSALDVQFPFRPGWIWVYIATFLFWVYQYTTVARESPERACRLAAADFVAKLVCFLCFVITPTFNVRPEVTTGGATGFLMRFIYWIDTPTNLFPSIHCFVAWLGTRFLYDTKNLRRPVFTRIVCTVGSILVFLSTLYTRQHVLLDVVAGIAVAEYGYLIAKYTPLTGTFQKLNARFMKTRLVDIL